MCTFFAKYLLETYFFSSVNIFIPIIEKIPYLSNPIFFVEYKVVCIISMYLITLNNEIVGETIAIIINAKKYNASTLLHLNNNLKTFKLMKTIRDLFRKI